MASILVFVQRTPQGLHPASASALCVARDIASKRGAAVVAIAAGDGGKFDEHVERLCGHYGADQLYFVGETGLRDLAARLQPKHLMAGWTREGITAFGKAQLGPLEQMLVSEVPVNGTLPATLGVIAGTLPWHSLGGSIDAEYQASAPEVPLPRWIEKGDGSLARGGGVVFVTPDGLAGPVPEALEAMGAHRAPVDYAANHRKGTLLWLAAGGEPLPMELSNRPAGSRVIVLPGPDPKLDDSWNLADWVLPGPWGSVVAQLGSPAWKAALA